MKTDKKTTALLAKAMSLVLVLGLALTGCGGNDDDDPSGNGGTGSGGGGGGGDGAIALTAGEWKDGELATESSVVKYKFSVTAGNIYYVWWNEAGTSSHGDGTQTGDIVVSATYNDGTVVTYGSAKTAFTKVDTAWSSSRSFTAEKSGTVILKVNASDNIGTFAIVYKIGTTEKPNSSRPMYFPTNTIPLTADKWVDGDLPDTKDSHWYVFDVQAETEYNIWLNRQSSTYSYPTSPFQGDCLKTAQVGIQAWHSDGTMLVGTANTLVTSAWMTPASVTPTSNGKIYVKVSYPSGGFPKSGTYGLVYSTNSAKPLPYADKGAVSLVANEWENGYLPNTTSTDWYVFDVTDGTEYNIWLNQWVTPEINEPANPDYGDRTKSAKVTIGYWYSDGTYIYLPFPLNAWGAKNISFTANTTGAVYVQIQVYGPSDSTAGYEWNTGSYGIVYNAGGAMPDAPFVVEDDFPLVADQWAENEIGYADGDMFWYSIPVTEGETYSIWLIGSGSGITGFTKTGAVKMTAYYSDKTAAGLKDTYASGSARTITASSTGKVYIRVVANSNAYKGTFAIAYNTSGTRPNAP